MTTEKPLLGDLLQKASLITKDQLDEALRAQKREGRRLGSVLMNLGYLKEEDLVGFLSRQYNVPGIKLSNFRFEPSVLALVPYRLARKHYTIPIHKGGGVLRVALADPSNHQALSEICALTGLRVSVYVAAQSAIISAIEKHYPAELKAAPPPQAEKPQSSPLERAEQTNSAPKFRSLTGLSEAGVQEGPGNEAPVPTLVDSILSNALKSRASDIHVEPAENTLRVRYRIDGVLHHVMQMPVEKGRELIDRIKAQSEMGNVKGPMPRDGRMKLAFGEGKEVDCRVSVFPTLFGEKVVVKILDKSLLQMDLSQLGFEGQALNDFLEAIEKSFGLVLVTGPAGSGKTTTLYSALSHLNKPGVNIMTIEDPVVYHLPGINQGQVRADQGINFVVSLQAVLRQDPDIIMVSELGDPETAQIAVQAATTGHRVISTLYTNDAPAAVGRLMDMGVKPFLLSSALSMIVSQRLVRKICTQCRETRDVDADDLLKAGVPGEEIEDMRCYAGRGCAGCDGTGFVGRTALHEVMPVKEAIRDLILREASATEIKREATRLGMLTLRRHGFNRVKEGITTIEEVLKVTPRD
ncbi:MAG: GspE/PulE family protein [Chloroflexota bacterium]